MSRPDDEADNTGVRALLSSLPDPGPMPDDLVARISASIAAEQTGRAAAPVEGAQPPAVVTPLPVSYEQHDRSSGSVVPLHRGSRRRWTAWAAMAGVAATVGVFAAANTDAFSGAGDAAAALSSVGASSTVGAAPTPITIVPEVGSQIRVAADDTAYTRATLPNLIAGVAAATTAAGGTDAPLTAEAAAACVTGLMQVEPNADVTTDGRTTVVLGRYEDTPATFVVSGTGASATVYPLERPCTEHHAVLLADPVTR